jgi:chromate reductase, NAD(P)H dehydrogenase (quinone)
VLSETSSLKLLGISGSLRTHSYNSGALRAVAPVTPEGAGFSIANLADLPFYNADVEQRGFPSSVERFRGEVAAADALILATPEYNFSVSGVLKNALEWLSRPPNPPAFGKPCAIFGASVSPLGTARGQFHLRHVCVSLNMIPVNVPHVDITNAKGKFDAESRLIDQPSIDALRQLVNELCTLSARLRAKSP